MGTSEAIRAVQRRADADRPAAEERWAVAGALDPGTLEPGSINRWVARFRDAGRLTLNFHPDRITRDGRSVAAGLARTGAYRSQWITGISSGSRSALPGGARQGFERSLFAGAYDDTAAASGAHPVYGAFDLLVDALGGSPRFGSSYVVLASHVRERATLCLGDSHAAPADVGTFDRPASVLAGLAEQAARHELLGRSLGFDALRSALTEARAPDHASRDLDGYIELQVHGGVSLADDVDAIVVDPSFRGTEVERDLATAAARYAIELSWHVGSELAVDDVPDDFRGPTMPALARRIAGPSGVVDAQAIGRAAAREPFAEPTVSGDGPDSAPQQLKYLWHTLLACGDDAARR